MNKKRTTYMAICCCQMSSGTQTSNQVIIIVSIFTARFQVATNITSNFLALGLVGYQVDSFLFGRVGQ
jgi:hypothetical protein